MMKPTVLSKFSVYKLINAGSIPQKQCPPKFELLIASFLKTSLNGEKWFAVPKLLVAVFV